MPNSHVKALRSVASRMRDELLEFAANMERPEDAREAKELGRRADEIACRALLEGLEEEGISCTLVCEDLGVLEVGRGGGGGLFLLADPLDGTRNFSRGVGVATISLAICSGPDMRHLEAGFVLDVFSGREFYAARGRGAFCEGNAISTSRTGKLEEAFISIDVSRLPEGAGWAEKLASKVDATRQLGSAALELCLLASGAFDAHVDLRGRIRPTDVAAGLLIAKEAGAKAWLRGTLKPAGALSPEERLYIVVANEGLFRPLMGFLAPHLPEGGVEL